MKRILFALCFLAPLAGCASMVGADFDNVVARPTECDLLEPLTADDRSALRCKSSDTCALREDGKATCVPLVDRRGFGDACTYANECAPGLTCSPALGCVFPCQAGAVCADGAACIEFTDVPTSPSGKRYGICPSPSCDPMAPSAPRDDLAPCASGNCRFITADHTVCLPGVAPTRSPKSCVWDTDCAATDVCFGGACKAMCTVGTTCVGGARCVAGTDDPEVPTLAGASYGHCP